MAAGRERRWGTSRAVNVSIVGTFLLLLIAALYFSRALMLPIVLALLVTFTFQPLVRSLGRYGVPPAVTAIVVVLGMAGAGVTASVMLADPVANVVEQAPQTIRDFRERFSTGRGVVSALVEAGEQVQEITGPADDGPGGTQRVVIAQPGFLAWAADTLSGVGSTLGATLILALFLLASGDLFLQKLVSVLPTLSDKKRSLRIVHDVESEVSRYLLTITLINLLFGCAVGVAMALLGMPHPVLWGIAAALLNYVPYLGALVGITLAAVTAVVTYPTLTVALLPPAAYLVLNILEGSVLTPFILGRRLELNAVVILIALAFFGWLWGVVGALIAVPVLVVVKVFCDHLPNLANFGEFLSGAEVEAPTPARTARADAAALEDSRPEV